MSALLGLLRKEIVHIRRDPRTLTVLIALPIIQVVLFGYAIRTDVTNVPNAESTLGCGGTITSELCSSDATSQACTGPAPPKANNGMPRQSTPRSVA